MGDCFRCINRSRVIHENETVFIKIDQPLVWNPEITALSNSTMTPLLSMEPLPIRDLTVIQNAAHTVTSELNISVPGQYSPGTTFPVHGTYICTRELIGRL